MILMPCTRSSSDLNGFFTGSCWSYCLAEFALPHHAAELLHERNVQGRELDWACLQQLADGPAEALIGFV